MPQRRHPIYLGTIALEVNRHAIGKCPTIRPSEWADRLLRSGFDGIELWENHVLLNASQEVDELCAAPLPVSVFNTYLEFTDDQESARLRVAELVRRLGATRVKYNVGADPRRRDEYIANVRRFAAQLPPSTALLCECHPGSIAEDPAAAASLMAELGPPKYFQAIAHTRNSPAEMRKWFAHLGKRITHLHVYLPTAERRREAIGGTTTFRTLAELGFDGSFTIEFVDPMNGPGETAASLLDNAEGDLRWLRQTRTQNFGEAEPS